MEESHDIFGMALRDYYQRPQDLLITVHSDIAEDDTIPIPYLFRTYQQMPTLEQRALDLARGTILDVGCGAGSHSLYLQKKGFDVTGIDISKGAIAVAKQRGLKKVEHTAFLDHTKKYDTLLLLMNGTGIFETIAQTTTYLKHAKKLLNPGGQILIDSTDIAYMFEEEDEGVWVRLNTEYYGEVTYSISYDGKTSSPFGWLYLDFETLTQIALKEGLASKLIVNGTHHDYLALITSQGSK